MLNNKRSILLCTLIAVTALIGCACSPSPVSQSSAPAAPAEAAKQVVIYSNADEEAVASMETALKKAGYDGKYVFQSYGTSELGGKMLAEGKDIEANIITMSSYFVDSAQEQHHMFAALTAAPKPEKNSSEYAAPLLANTGALFVNTELIKSKGLPMPTSIKDLTNPVYKDLVSVPNIASSSTAWLMVQAVVSAYGEEEGAKVLHDLAVNCGPHIEKSGSGPIKKVRAGEVAVGFGLRHQAVADNAAGKPIQCIDPIEGNFTLLESLAVVQKDGATTALAQEMAAVILKDSRKDLLAVYPVTLYAGESVESVNIPAYPKQYKDPLTVQLLESHIALFENAQ